MLQDFQNVLNFSITVGDAIENIFFSLLCGFIISIFYRATYRGPGYSVSFINSLIALAMITSIVIMVIGNNLARAFGLVGAMSIIRFRTAVKETLDIVFIFFSLVMGLAAGVGFHFIAVISSLLIGSIIFVLGKVSLVTPPKQNFLLQFTYLGKEDEEKAPYLPILKQYCKTSSLMNVKSAGDTNMLELSYYIRLKNSNQNPELVSELKKVSGVNHVNLYFDEETF